MSALWRRRKPKPPTPGRVRVRICVEIEASVPDVSNAKSPIEARIVHLLTTDGYAVNSFLFEPPIEELRANHEAILRSMNLEPEVVG